MTRCCFVAVASFAVLASAAHAQRGAAPAAPTALTVSGATRSAVALTWTGASGKFIIERKGLGGAWPAPTPAPAPGATPRDPNAPLTPAVVATVDAPSAADSKIDAFATYVYRIRAVGPGDALSAPSNEVTAGPPPVGFSSVIASPKAMHDYDPALFASQIRMVFDANGDPALAYVTYDLNHDGEPNDTELALITWNRARYRWNPPVQVDLVGNISRSGSRVPFSIARDESTGRFGLAYMVGEHEMRLAWSDDAGMTWKKVSVQTTTSDDGTLATPALAMGGGRVHVAYFLGGVGVRYRTGAADSVAKWTSSTAPLIPGAAEARAEGVTVLLDTAGKPFLVYCLNAGDYNVAVAFWRPGSASALKVTDTDNHQTDDPAIHVAVVGSQIALAFYANRDEHFFENHQEWFARSTDNGATWSRPVAVANDGGHSMGSPVTVTIDRAGHFAIAAENPGGNSDGVKCGVPKLMRSADGVNWTTCAPETKGAPSTSQVTYPVVAFAGNDKLYLAFKARAEAPGLPPGLVLWRER